MSAVASWAAWVGHCPIRDFGAARQRACGCLAGVAVGDHRVGMVGARDRAASDETRVRGRAQVADRLGQGAFQGAGHAPPVAHAALALRVRWAAGFLVEADFLTGAGFGFVSGAGSGGLFRRVAHSSHQSATPPRVPVVHAERSVGDPWRVREADSAPPLVTLDASGLGAGHPLCSPFGPMFRRS